jgi:transposase
MARAYSQDLRERVINAVTTGGMSRHGAARRFGVSVASAVKWVQHFERTGSRTDRGTGGHRPSQVREHRGWLLELVNEEFSLTLREMCARLDEVHGVKADPGILSRFFRAEAISIKKKRAGQRAAAARRRA